jgi:RNA-directed DNA polymerase
MSAARGGAAVVVRGRESRPHGEGRQSTETTEAQVTDTRGMYLMNIGELQRSLCRKAAQQPGHRFGDLFNLTFHTEWLRLAHEHVAQNAGSKTAGCDGVVMADFDADLEGNLRKLAEALKSGTFEARPVRRVYIPKANGKMRPLGIPMSRAYCSPLQQPWGWNHGRRSDAVSDHCSLAAPIRTGHSIRQRLLR